MSLKARGKRQRRYKAADYATPGEKLKPLPEAASGLTAGLGFERPDAFAMGISGTDCARKTRAAKVRLLRRCKSESPSPPRTF